MKKQNVDLICSIGELAGLFEKSANLKDFLQTVVSVVAYHMKAAVCSIYLYDDDARRLVLRANQGLNPDSIGKLSLKLGEGLTGLALKELRPICDGNATKNPHFRLFPDSFEEQYRSFLAVPILRGLSRVGVLVVQDPQRDYFDENDVKALQAISAQLSTTIENATLLLTLHGFESDLAVHTGTSKEQGRFIKGIPASRGFAWGKADIFGRGGGPFHFDVPNATAERTPEDFEVALAKTSDQLKKLQRDMDERLADVASLIFSAHLLILSDSEFSGAMRSLIEAGQTPQDAISAVVNKYVTLFSRSSNSKLREKVQDVKDLGHRLINNLVGEEAGEGDYEGHVVMAGEIMPSDILKFSAQRAAGLVLVGVSASSHVSILARSMGLPVVITNERSIFDIPPGTTVLIDATQGTVMIDPSQEVIEQYEGLQRGQEQSRSASQVVEDTTWTSDGCRVRLLANINILSELAHANELKAEGVGLYRSEFPFIVRNDFPSEEEQIRVYARLLEAMGGKEVIFRTLDIGGDKMLSYYTTVNEANPFLGLRAIRFSLKNKDIFATQLRALLRAGLDRDLSIVFPLISSLDDFTAARDVVRECSRALTEEGIPHNDRPRLGIMVELPSAVEIVDALAEEADFLCIGSNDLVQYYLAVDRTNQQIADLYLSHHPAVLRALKKVAGAAAAHNVPVSICGDMAGDERLIPFLLGIGVHTLSIAPDWIPRTQSRIRNISIADAEETATALLAMSRIDDIERYLGIEN